MHGRQARVQSDTERGQRGAGTVEESARKRGGDSERARGGERERERTQTGHRMSACLDNNDL